MGFLNVDSLDELAELLRSGELDIVGSLNRWLDELDHVERSPKPQVRFSRGQKVRGGKNVDESISEFKRLKDPNSRSHRRSL